MVWNPPNSAWTGVGCSTFGTDLNHEYEVLVDHFGFGADELEQASLNGLRASFLHQVEKARLETEFRAQFARLREELDHE